MQERTGDAANMSSAIPQATAASSRRISWRALEFAVVFIGLPLFAGWQGAAFRRWVIPQIWLLAGAALLVLLRDPGFARRCLSLRPRGDRSGVLRILLIFIVGSCGLLAMVAWSMPENLFRMPAERPGVWLMILALYPLLSAVPQEVVFRVFVFHRYAGLFPNPRAMIAASAASFALAHLQLGNPWAPALALIGGILFAFSYSRSRTLFQPALEHALWGDWIFSVGLGSYFYGGHF
jgi:membrane protease YdiL (CAAX protease family)